MAHEATAHMVSYAVQDGDRRLSWWRCNSCCMVVTRADALQHHDHGDEGMVVGMVGA